MTQRLQWIWQEQAGISPRENYRGRARAIALENRPGAEWYSPLSQFFMAAALGASAIASMGMSHNNQASHTPGHQETSADNVLAAKAPPSVKDDYFENTPNGEPLFISITPEPSKEVRDAHFENMTGVNTLTTAAPRIKKVKSDVSVRHTPPVTAPFTVRLKSGIQAAFNKTGFDSEYLWHLSAAETSHNPRRARTSSADGPYQFIDQTWLNTVVEFGGQTKHGAYIKKHVVARHGRYKIPNKKARHFIMHKLRYDPYFSSLMAAEFSKKNLQALQAELGKNVTKTQLYSAHFMGISGALEFIREMQIDPYQYSADIAPAAAQSNRTIFFTRDFEKATMSHTFKLLEKKMPPEPVVMKKPTSAASYRSKT